jgi:hypothetical protein
MGIMKVRAELSRIIPIELSESGRFALYNHLVGVPELVAELRLGDVRGAIISIGMGYIAWIIGAQASPRTALYLKYFLKKRSVYQQQRHGFRFPSEWKS